MVSWEYVSCRMCRARNTSVTMYCGLVASPGMSTDSQHLLSVQCHPQTHSASSPAPKSVIETMGTGPKMEPYGTPPVIDHQPGVTPFPEALWQPLVHPSRCFCPAVCFDQEACSFLQCCTVFSAFSPTVSQGMNALLFLGSLKQTPEVAPPQAVMLCPVHCLPLCSRS